MLFNSLEFAVFFPLVVLGYFSIRHSIRWVWLLAASCIFYAVYIPEYLLILLLTITVDYYAGILIEQRKGKWRPLMLCVIIVTTCSILFFFKYYNFALNVFVDLCRICGFESKLSVGAKSSFPL